MGAAAKRVAIAELMARFRSGDSVAAGQLVEFFYPELRRLAAARMKAERIEHTWQPTVLINELYIELVKMKSLRASPDSDGEGERAAFLGLAARLMKQLLIRHARPLAHRVSRAGKTPLADLPELCDQRHAGADVLAEIESVLDRLAAIDPKLRTVVELRVFEGLTGHEIAERMACAPATVTRYWTFARQWLSQEFGSV